MVTLHSNNWKDVWQKTASGKMGVPQVEKTHHVTTWVENRSSTLLNRGDLRVGVTKFHSVTKLDVKPGDIIANRKKLTIFYKNDK